MSIKANYRTLEGLNCDIEVKEESDTFAEDALTKAIAYAEATQMVTISQDRGFIFDELNWPGTLSKEVMFGDANVAVGVDGFPLFDKGVEFDKLDRARLVLKSIEGKSRKMTVINATAVSFPNGDSMVAETRTHGYALEEPQDGIEGAFSLFFVPEGYNKPMSTMFETSDELIKYWADVIAPIPDNIVYFVEVKSEIEKE